MASRRKKKPLVDDDGVEIKAGDVLCFGYGIPPIGVEARVIDRDGTLVALTPGHFPAESRVDHITPFFNCWVKQVRSSP